MKILFFILGLSLFKFTTDYSFETFKSIAVLKENNDTDMSSLPYQSLMSLDTCIRLNQVEIHQPTIIIYLHRENCESCNKVVEEINAMVSKNKINPKQIVFVCVFDYDSASLIKDVQENFDKYPFFKTQNNVHGLSLPTICGYDSQGKLEWLEPAHNQAVSKRILFHAKKIKSVYNGQSIFVNVTQSELEADTDSSLIKSPLNIEHPIDSIFILEKYKSLTGIKPEYPTLVIYTFLGCKPCNKLAEKIKADCIKRRINPKQVVFINPIDKIPPSFTTYVKSNYAIFPYFLSLKDKGILACPTTCAYDSNGQRLWLYSGYSIFLYGKIKAHLKLKK